jgi:hypothetical protein
LLREVLAEMHGDMYVATMTAIGLYWDRVLCPEHRWVAAAAGPGLGCTVANRGTEALEAVPVELTFSNGRRTLVLVDVAAGGSAVIQWSREKA